MTVTSLFTDMAGSAPFLTPVIPKHSGQVLACASAPFRGLLLPRSCSLLFEPAAPLSCPLYSKTVLAAHLEIFAQPILPSSCGLVQASHDTHFPHWWLVRTRTHDPVLANEIWEEVYRGFCESFSFLKRKRWARKKVPPCFWLEHSATHYVVLRNSSPSSAKQGSREKEVLEPPQLWHNCGWCLKNMSLQLQVSLWPPWTVTTIFPGQGWAEMSPQSHLNPSLSWLLRAPRTDEGQGFLCLWGLWALGSYVIPQCCCYRKSPLGHLRISSPPTERQVWNSEREAEGDHMEGGKMMQRFQSLSTVSFSLPPILLFPHLSLSQIKFLWLLGRIEFPGGGPSEAGPVERLFSSG